VASTDSGDLIAIDEPENALHPHAIKLLLEHMREWSQRYSTTILLATHRR
jgi:predicted ATPase